MTKLLWLDVKEWSHSTTGTDALDFLHTVLINELVMQKEASRDWYDKLVILTLLLSRGKTDGGLSENITAMTYFRLLHKETDEKLHVD